MCDAIAARISPAAPAKDQLKSVKALVMDFDGVLTDDHAFVDQNGIESVRVSRSDGLGLEQLRKASGDPDTDFVEGTKPGCFSAG